MSYKEFRAKTVDDAITQKLLPDSLDFSAERKQSSRHA